MKVLMINSVCGIRSTGRICTDLADVLAENGYDVKIAYGRETVPEKYQKYAVRIGTDIDNKIHAIQTRLFDTHGFGSKKATADFLKWADNYDPDILHLHNIHGYYINVEMLFQWIKSRPQMKVIWTLHDCWAFTGHCAHFTIANCLQWKTCCKQCIQLKSYPACDFVGNVERNFKRKKSAFTGVKDMTIVTPSKWLAGLVGDSFLNRYSVKVINNGIDTSIFKPTPSDFRNKYHLENKKIILGVASSWSVAKGLNDFIQLSKMLDDEYKIVLVGLSEKQIKEVPDNIIKISRTNSAVELAEIYTAADAFVNPSRQETMGLTTVEAYACGTPVVVSNLTAVPEVVNENCGMILEQLDLSEIKHDIDIVLNRTWTNIEQEALRYSKRNKYGIYLELYNEL